MHPWSHYRVARQLVSCVFVMAGSLLILLIGPVVAQSPRLGPSSLPNLTGDYLCKQQCPAGGEGKTAKIIQTGTILELTNEGGQKSKGKFVAATTIEATGWGKLKGTVENDGKKITWDNGTIWERVNP